MTNLWPKAATMIRTIDLSIPSTRRRLVVVQPPTFMEGLLEEWKEGREIRPGTPL